MLDHAAIQTLLPHRFPILLLDRVDDFVAGDRLTASRTITAAEPCYNRLPDGLPRSAYAYPVPLLLESFAQAAGVMWLLSMRASDAQDHVLVLAGLRDCRIESAAFPGDVLRHVARFGHMGKDAAYGMGETCVGNRRIATMGTFLAVRRPRAEVFGRCPATP